MKVNPHLKEDYPFFYKLSAEESLDIDNKNDLDYFKYFIRKTSKNTKAI